MSTATKPKVINGLSFDIRQPYAEGHVLSAVEAGVLNQTRAENVGNNVRQRISDMIDGREAEGTEGTRGYKPAVAKASEAEIQSFVADFDVNYEFRTASEGAGRSRDPYETEARKIARELLKEHLAQTGRKLNVAPDGETVDSWKEKIDAKIDQLASADAVLAQAKKNVNAKKKQSETLLAALSDGADL